MWHFPYKPLHLGFNTKCTLHVFTYKETTTFRTIELDTQNLDISFDVYAFCNAKQHQWQYANVYYRKCESRYHLSPINYCINVGKTKASLAGIVERLTFVILVLFWN